MQMKPLILLEILLLSLIRPLKMHMMRLI